MKKTLLIAAAILTAAAVMFTGCKKDEDEHNILSIKGDTASVAYENTTDTTHRGFVTLKTKHTDAVAIVELDPANCTSSQGRIGVLGFIFDLQDRKAKNAENKDVKVYDFSTVSLRVNGQDVETYISRFEGVDPSKMDGGNNFKGWDGKELGTTASSVTGAKEIEVLKGTSSAFAKLTGCTKIDGKYKVAIEVIANANGTYGVKFYDGSTAVAEEKEETIDGQKIKTGQIKAGATPLTLTSKSGDTTVDASWKEGATKTVQTYMGFYSAVYPGCKLVGSIKLPYILNEDEVIEWAE